MASPDGPPYRAHRDDFQTTWSASCFCGAVTWEVEGDALSSMYCHCETCQTLHGAPYQWAAVIHKDHVKVTSPLQGLAFYSASRRESIYEPPVKISCRACRAPIADEGRNMMLLFPGYIHFPRDKDGRKRVPQAWRAQHHMFYGRRVADMHDGLDKYLTKKGEGMCDDAGRPLESPKV